MLSWWSVVRGQWFVFGLWTLDFGLWKISKAQLLKPNSLAQITTDHEQLTTDTLIKLLQKAQVVLEQQSNVIEVVH
jgi:hypothetical protein